jgi:hypothetical protein
LVLLQVSLLSQHSERQGKEDIKRERRKRGKEAWKLRRKGGTKDNGRLELK